jgi:4-hydroxybenzoate polyprenyltransferase
MDWKLFGEILAIASLAMTTNDIFDAAHDGHSKGKWFAFVYRTKLIIFVAFAWISILLASFYIITPLGSDHWVLLITIGISITYSLIHRKVVALPALLVAYASASPILIIHNMYGGDTSLCVYCGILSMIVGRELLKDLIDAPTDAGYKKTLLTVGYSRRTVVLLVFGFISMGVVLFETSTISLIHNPLLQIAFQIGTNLPFATTMLPILLPQFPLSYGTIKRFIDIGMCIMGIVILAS